MKFATKPMRHYRTHLRRVAALPWKLKIQIFCRCGRKCEKNCIFNRLWLCYSSTNFDIFSV